MSQSPQLITSLSRTTPHHDRALRKFSRIVCPHLTDVKCNLEQVGHRIDAVWLILWFASIVLRGLGVVSEGCSAQFVPEEGLAT